MGTIERGVDLNAVERRRIVMQMRTLSRSPAFFSRWIRPSGRADSCHGPVLRDDRSGLQFFDRAIGLPTLSTRSGASRRRSNVDLRSWFTWLAHRSPWL